MSMALGRSMYQPDFVEVPLGEPSGGRYSSLSPAKTIVANPHCFKLLKQVEAPARALARLREGNKSEARTAMMAMTTSNSINVNARPMRERPLTPAGMERSMRARQPVATHFL